MSQAKLAFFERIISPRWPVPVLLLLATLLTYANSFPGIFIQDDIHIVANNPLVAQMDLGRIFRSQYWQGIESNQLYRPLTILSLALNRWLLGPDPSGFHLVNVLLHAAVSVLCWRMLLRWGFTSLQAALAALLFSVHPIHTEVVNQVVGRGELLAALFLLLSLAGARGEGWLAGAATGAFFLAALLSKEHALTLLLMLPLLDGYFSSDFKATLRRRAPLYGALLLLAGAWLLWRQFGVIQEFPLTIMPPEVAPLVYLSWDGRFLSAAMLQGVYLGKLLMPLGLQGVYVASDLPALIPSAFSPRGLLVLGLLAALVMVLRRAWRRRRQLVLPAVLYFASFMLTANLLLPTGVTLAERFAYFPSVWFCAFLGVVLAQLIQHQRLRKVGWVVTCVYLLLLPALTFARNPDFSHELRYWAVDVQRNPRNHLALVNYAAQLAMAGRQQEAEAAYGRLVAEVPTFAFAHRAQGNFCLAQGRLDEGMTAFQRALALSQERGDRTGMGYDLGDLARIHLERQEFSRALERLDEAARQLGRDDFDLDLRGAALAGLGRYEEALSAFRRRKRADLSPTIQYHLAMALFQNGRLEEARARLEDQLRLGQGRAEHWNLLGVAHAQLGEMPAAIRAFSHATQLAPEIDYYQENLLRAKDLEGAR